MFDTCEFLLGEGSSIVIVVPGYLPEAESYTVSVTKDRLKFRAGYENIAELEYEGREIFERLAMYSQVGLVEYPPNNGKFPKEITNVAYIEVMRGFS